MKTTIAIGLAIAILLPASLCAANPIRIETKIFESDGIKIPHDLTEIAKLKGVRILNTPSVTTKPAQDTKVEIIEEYQPASVTKEDFDSVNTGITLAINPEQEGDSIAFTGTLTISRLVGEGKRADQTQSEIISRTIYFSGNQKAGQEGWFDLVNPITGRQAEWIGVGENNAANLPQQNKITVWIRFDIPNADLQQGPMVQLVTDLPLAKHDRSQGPLPQSSQAFMVPEGTRLLSRGTEVTSSDSPPLLGKLAHITDGNVEQERDYHVELMDGLQWVQLDLGKPHALYAILVWHYYLPELEDYWTGGEQPWLARVYQDVVIQISNDPSFQKSVTTVYNNDHDNSSGLGKGSDVSYVETKDGRWINAKGVEGRYVRLYSNGHKNLLVGKVRFDSKSNDYIEVEVYGK